jgi:hypothetical protein
LSNQVLHSYNTTGKIRVLYISIFICLDSKLEDRRFLHWLIASTPWH